jgi:hypothetical protein
MLLDFDNNILLVTHIHSTETDQTYKMLPELLSKRRNIGIGILIDQILTTHMNVHEMEPTYASGETAHELINYI